MINKAFKEYMEEINNPEKNYKKILSKEKGVVNMKMNTKKLVNIAAIFIAIVIVGVASTQIYAKIQWDIQFKEYQRRPVGEAKGTLEVAKDLGYAVAVDMDYITQDGISAKVESILLTDDCFNADIKFKFDEGKEVNSETFVYSYAVYDENNQIYQIFGRMHLGGKTQKYDKLTPFTYKELGVKYDKQDIYSAQLADSGGVGSVEANEAEKTITTQLTLRARDSFPRSKKLYIRVFDLGYMMLDSETRTAEDFQVSEAEWIFEIEVPDKFYERETLELKPEHEIPGIEFSKITITEAGLVLNFQSEAYLDLIAKGKDMKGNEFSEATKTMLNITDAEGKVYQDIGGGTTKDNGYKMTIDAGKNDLAKRLYINFKVDGKQYTEELVEKQREEKGW